MNRAEGPRSFAPSTQKEARLALAPMRHEHERAFVEFASSGGRPALLGTDAEGELRDLFYSLLHHGTDSFSARTEVVLGPSGAVLGFSVESPAGEGRVVWDMLVDVDRVSFQAEASLAERIVARAEAAGVEQIERALRPGMHRSRLVLAGLGFLVDEAGHASKPMSHKVR